MGKCFELVLNITDSIFHWANPVLFLLCILILPTLFLESLPYFIWSSLSSHLVLSLSLSASYLYLSEDIKNFSKMITFTGLFFRLMFCFPCIFYIPQLGAVFLVQVFKGKQSRQSALGSARWLGGASRILRFYLQLVRTALTQYQCLAGILLGLRLDLLFL